MQHILEYIRLSNTCRTDQKQVAFIYSSVMREVWVFGDVEVDSWVYGLVALLNGLILAGELV